MSGSHPAFALFATALVVAVLRGRLQRLALVGGAILAIFAWSRLEPGEDWFWSLRGYQLHLLHVDRLSLVFGLVFSIITLIGIVYALHVRRGSEHAATLAYAGGSLGVVFAGDWLTLFVFWELMAVASLFVIWYGDSEKAGGAGFRYLLVHISGGSLLFAGILVHLSRGGSISLQALTAGDVDALAFWLILLGVAINAAIPPLHAWLTDAYPEASVSGSVFLSVYTTKTAVYVLIRFFPGAEVLVWAGVIMALYGVVFAVLENDIRRLLAYHIVSQVGYMVAGVGMGTELALNGSAAHAFSHILYKALLFMGAGAVIFSTGRRKLTELGGIGPQMKLVLVLYTVGAFSISGVPLFNGFISKSMVVSAAAAAHRPVVEILLTLAAVGTFLHTGLKLPYFTFFGPHRGIKVSPVPKNMLVAMGAAALLCTGMGIFPGLLYLQLPSQIDYHPYTVDHVVSAVQLLIGTGVGFWLLLSKLGGEATISLDTDWLYRKPLQKTFQGMVAAVRSAGQSLEALGAALLERTAPFFHNPGLFLPASRGRGEAPAEFDADRYRRPIGFTVFWILVYFVVVALVAWAT